MPYLSSELRFVCDAIAFIAFDIPIPPVQGLISRSPLLQHKTKEDLGCVVFNRYCIFRAQKEEGYFHSNSFWTDFSDAYEFHPGFHFDKGSMRRIAKR